MGDIITYRFTADDGNGSYQHIRRGARAILMKDEKILLGKEFASGYCCIPGGGHEKNETLQETCFREIAEEMGILVDVLEEKAVVESLWKDKIYENHFFHCVYKGETIRNLTEQEAQMDLQPLWVTFEEACEIFSDPQTVTKSSAWRGCYKRDLWMLEHIIRPMIDGM